MEMQIPLWSREEEAMAAREEEAMAALRGRRPRSGGARAAAGGGHGGARGGGHGGSPAAREPRREAAMAEHRQPKSLRRRPRSLRADELPVSRSSTMVPPHRAGSSPSWAHLTEATASCRRCHAPATDRDLRRGERRTHICVLHGVLPILGLSVVGARFLPVA